MSAIASVSVAIDGKSYGNANYGTSRADVCAAYPNSVGCPNVGWTFSLDTTSLSNGAHTFSITAVTRDLIPRQTTKSVTFSIKNGGNALDPTAPKKEYIYMNGKVVAIENRQ